MTAPDSIKAAREAHERLASRDLRQHCSCGWTSDERRGIAAHRDHLATVLAALIPEAEVTREWGVRSSEGVATFPHAAEPWARDCAKRWGGTAVSRIRESRPDVVGEWEAES